MNYTLRIFDASRSDLKTEADSVPRTGETVLIGKSLFLVTGVRHVIEPDDGSNRGVASTEIVVLCRIYE